MASAMSGDVDSIPAVVAAMAAEGVVADVSTFEVIVNACDVVAGGKWSVASTALSALLDPFGCGSSGVCAALWALVHARCHDFDHARQRIAKVRRLLVRLHVWMVCGTCVARRTAHWCMHASACDQAASQFGSELRQSSLNGVGGVRCVVECARAYCAVAEEMVAAGATGSVVEGVVEEMLRVCGGMHAAVRDCMQRCAVTASSVCEDGCRWLPQLHRAFEAVMGAFLSQNMAEQALRVVAVYTAAVRGLEPLVLPYPTVTIAVEWGVDVAAGKQAATRGGGGGSKVAVSVPSGGMQLSLPSAEGDAAARLQCDALCWPLVALVRCYARYHVDAAVLPRDVIVLLTDNKVRDSWPCDAACVAGCRRCSCQRCCVLVASRFDVRLPNECLH
jgi:hypothetical protein